MIFHEIAPHVTVKRAAAHEVAAKPVKRGRTAPVERPPEPAVHSDLSVAPLQPESVALRNGPGKVPATYDSRSEKAVHEQAAEGKENAAPLPSPEEAIVQLAKVRNRQAKLVAAEEPALVLQASAARARLAELRNAERLAALRAEEESSALETRGWAANLSDAEGDAAIAQIDAKIAALIRSGADGSPEIAAVLISKKAAIQDAQLERARAQQEVQREQALQRARKQVQVERMKTAERVHKQHLEAQFAQERRTEAAHHKDGLISNAKRDATRRVLSAHLDEGQRIKLLRRNSDDLTVTQEIATFRQKGFGNHEAILAAGTLS